MQKFAAVGAVALAPSVVTAAPIDLAADGYTLDGSSFGLADVTVTIDAFGDLFADDPLFNFIAAFDVTNAADFDASIDLDGFFTDTLTASGGTEVGFITDGIEVLFEGITTTGTLAAYDGGAVLITLSDTGLSAPSAFAGAGTGTITIEGLASIPPIPLPAGGVLLLTAAGALLLRKRRQS